MVKTNTGLVAYCKAQLGMPYWYGCFGQIGTQSLFSVKSKQYPKYYDRNKYTQGWSHQYGHRVHDCVGLIKGYLWSDTPTSVPQYNAAQDVSANGMLSVCKEKGKIATIPDVPGILVFSPQHVGVYIGNGEVIEARGHDYGVVKTQLKARPWVNWGKCPYLDYGTASTAPAAPAAKPKKYIIICTALNVRSGPGTGNKIVGGYTKGQTVNVTEVKGTWGRIGANEWISVKPAYVKEIK